MANNNINQEQTRQNIVKLRKEHGYTQAKVAELMGGSRTIYNGIENGKVNISEYYVQSLADVYGVDFESIAVFASGYDEGFYQGMQTKLKLEDSQFDTDSMKVYHMGKELLTGKKYKSTLYPALKAMGYRIEVVDIKDLDADNVPKTVKDQLTDGKVFVLMKGLNNYWYFAPSQFYNFEEFMNMAVNGFLSEIKAENKKTNGIHITYRTTPPSTKRYAPYKAAKFKNAKGYKVVTRQDKTSAGQQMKEIQEELRSRGIREGEDEDGEDS